MGQGPYRPIREIESALGHGELRRATAIARDFAHEHGRPIPIEAALRFLPVVAAQRDDYDDWAGRWLARWLTEAPGANMDRAADLAAALAELPAEPMALKVIQEVIKQPLISS
jgi:hypothetical protein